MKKMECLWKKSPAAFNVEVSGTKPLQYISSAAHGRAGAALFLLFWRKAVAMTPYRFNSVGAQLAPELVDHAGDPRPAGVK